MKRIAFIEEAFMGSTLPLAKQFCKDGYAVDIYYLRNFIKEPEGTCCDFAAEDERITRVPDVNLKEIRKYVGCDNINIYLVRLMRPFESVPVARTIARYIMNRHLQQMTAVVDSKGYEFVNVIANYNVNRFTNIIYYLKSKTILSLHEVWDHSSPSPKPSRLLKAAIKKGIDIIVYSKNTYNDIKNIQGIDIKKVKVIPFGLFESYSSLEEEPTPEMLPKKFILFYGYIVPYKGLDILKKAIDIIGDNLHDYKVVIAGDGNDPILKEIGNDSRFLCIKRFIKNRELGYIIRRAYAVVCPYKTMSQSGIPQTTFVFNTPIIASNLNGFKEIIDESNGILFKANDAKALADAISKLIEDKSLRTQLANNIKDFACNHPVLDWNNIRKAYSMYDS